MWFLQQRWIHLTILTDTGNLLQRRKRGFGDEKKKIPFSQSDVIKLHFLSTNRPTQPPELWPFLLVDVLRGHEDNM